MSLDPCYACENALRPFDLEPCVYCSTVYGETGTHPYFKRKKPYTNYDRIKCFDADALADALAHKADACWNCTSDGLDTCKSCWLDWLKQEAIE